MLGAVPESARPRRPHRFGPPLSDAAVRTNGYDGRMVRSPNIRFSLPRAATWSWARAVGVMAMVVIGGCSEDTESCSKCPGTNVGPVGDCLPTRGLIVYEVVIDETLYTLVCGREPAEELTPRDYDAVVNCDYGFLLINQDVDSVQIRARAFDGTWSTNGWQTVQAQIPPGCGCVTRLVAVIGSCGPGAPEANTPQPDAGGEDAGS